MKNGVLRWRQSERQIRKSSGWAASAIKLKKKRRYLIKNQLAALINCARWSGGKTSKGNRKKKKWAVPHEAIWQIIDVDMLQRNIAQIPAIQSSETRFGSTQ